MEITIQKTTELKIKKTKEQTITITNLPRYFRNSHFYKTYKITDKGILYISENMIFFHIKDTSNVFAEEVLEIMRYEEINEENFNENLESKINKFKNI